MPAAAAADVLALRSEWALNTSVSIPAFPSRILSHLAMVDEQLACGVWSPQGTLSSDPLAICWCGIHIPLMLSLGKGGHRVYTGGNRTPFRASVV